MPETMSDLWWLFSRQTVSVTQQESVFKAAVLMQRRNFRHLPVLSESRIMIGMVSAQDIIDSLYLVSRSSSSVAELKRSLDIPVERIMSYPTVFVEPGDGLTEVLKKFVYNNLGALAVVDEKGSLQGVVTLRDLIGLLGMSSNPLGVTVNEIMNTTVTTIEPDSPVSHAVKLMSEGRIRRLPIASRRGDLLGVVTNKDVLRLLARMEGMSSSDSPFETPISSIMTRDVITVGREDDIRTAASQMMIFGVGGLIIKDVPNELALITERDVIRRVPSKRSIDFLANAMQYELEVSDVQTKARASGQSLSL